MKIKMTELLLLKEYQFTLSRFSPTAAKWGHGYIQYEILAVVFICVNHMKRTFNNTLLHAKYKHRSPKKKFQVKKNNYRELDFQNLKIGLFLFFFSSDVIALKLKNRFLLTMICCSIYHWLEVSHEVDISRARSASDILTDN